MTSCSRQDLFASFDGIHPAEHRKQYSTVALNTATYTYQKAADIEMPTLSDVDAKRTVYRYGSLLHSPCPLCVSVRRSLQRAPFDCNMRNIELSSVGIE